MELKKNSRTALSIGNYLYNQQLYLDGHRTGKRSGFCGNLFHGKRTTFEVGNKRKAYDSFLLKETQEADNRRVHCATTGRTGLRTQSNCCKIGLECNSSKNGAGDVVTTGARGPDLNRLEGEAA